MNDSGLSYPSIAGLAIAGLPAWTSALMGEFELPFRVLLLVFGVVLSWLALKTFRVLEFSRGGKLVYLTSTFLSLLVFNLLEEKFLDINDDLLFGACILIPLVCVEVYLHAKNKC